MKSTIRITPFFFLLSTLNNINWQADFSQLEQVAVVHQVKYSHKITFSIRYFNFTAKTLHRFYQDRDRAYQPCLVPRGSPLPAQPRTACQPPRTTSLCPSDAAAGLVCSSPHHSPTSAWHPCKFNQCQKQGRVTQNHQQLFAQWTSTTAWANKQDPKPIHFKSYCDREKEKTNESSIQNWFLLALRRL